MASIEVSRAAPIAVPRPVASGSSAASRRSPSVVGGTTSAAEPEKTTSPIRVPAGWSPMNERTAACAAASRLGETSVAHIERDTSSARMIDVRDWGTETDAVAGPPPGHTSSTAPSMRATGMCGRHRDRGGRAALTSETLGWATAYLRRRRSCHTYAAASASGSSSRGRASGQAKDT